MTTSIKNFINSQLPSNVTFAILASNIRAVLTALVDWVANVITGSTYFQASQTFSSNALVTITHNLNLTDPNHMVVQARNTATGRVEVIEVVNATANNFQIRVIPAAYPVTCRIMVVGTANPNYVIRRMMIRTDLPAIELNNEVKDQIVIMTATGPKSVTIPADFPANCELTISNASNSGNITVSFPGGVLGNYASNQPFFVQPNNGSTSFNVLQDTFKSALKVVRTDAGFWVLL